MQYLLTEDERKALVHKDELVEANHALAAAREKLLALAGFDCIHDRAGRNFRGYCDGCPCNPVHNMAAYKTWERVCWLDKRQHQ